MQPFGHSRAYASVTDRTDRTDRHDRQTDNGLIAQGEPFYKPSPKKTIKDARLACMRKPEVEIWRKPLKRTRSTRLPIWV